MPAVVRGVRAAVARDHDGERQRVREGVAQGHRHVEAVALGLGVGCGVECGRRRFDQLDVGLIAFLPRLVKVKPL